MEHIRDQQNSFVRASVTSEKLVSTSGEMFGFLLLLLLHCHTVLTV